MDQNAFRNLLSAPRADAGSSQGHQKGRLAGSAPKRTAWGLKQTKEYKLSNKDDDKPKGDDVKTGHMAPRHVRRKPEDGKYKDRAEMRRQGKDDEFKEVEKLLEDFERRAVEEGQDAEKIQEQRQYLGGDATHSILVKGLDYALLAQRKAELERQGDEEKDDELDAIALEMAAQEKGKRLGKMDKNQLGDGEAGNQDRAVKEEKMSNKFKSIGKKSDDTANGEKKKKKKKKKAVLANPDGQDARAGTGPGEPQTRLSEGSSTMANRTDMSGPSVPGPSIVKAEPSTGQASTSVTKKETLPEPEADDDEDIFGDAGTYDLNAGGSSDDDDEDDEVMAKGAKAEVRETDGKALGRERDERRERARSRDRVESRNLSRSRSRSRDDRYQDRSYNRRHDRQDRYPRRMSRSPSRTRSRSRSHSRDGYRAQQRRDDRYGPSRRSRSPYRRPRSYTPSRSRSRDRDRDGHKRRRYADQEEHGYRHRQYSPSPPPQRRGRYSRSYSYSRSPSPDRRQSKRYRPSSRSYSRSPTPDYRARSPSPLLAPSADANQHSPPPDRKPRRSRSPTPSLLFAGPPLSPSPSRSPSPGPGGTGPSGKLQPLQSSAITDLSSFLAADQAAAKEDEKRLKKAKWRAAQGLSVQEGVDLRKLEREVGEGEKRNREYVQLMGRLKKAEGAEGKEKGEGQ